MRPAAVLALCAAAAAPAPALAQGRNAETVLMSPDERVRRGQEELGYADAVVAGDLVFLSGIVAWRQPGETGLAAAYERSWRQIAAILERAGSSPADVVEVTSFHTDVTAQIEQYSAVQRRVLGSPPPAWTAIDVDRLLPDNGITEIRIIARRRPVAAAG
ncbi:MAG TPA: Rid family hydrolase [Allosphingosinicella sp.]|jgi:enamine deaminase RidA (YjgF/YER057c/UK114 family)